jgi:hypothetical protein
MSLVIRLKNVHTNNPALPIVNTGVHPVTPLLVAEYDMLSFLDDGVTLLDQSGNGHAASFNGPPIRDYEGVTFDGSRYANTGLSNRGVNMAAFVVVEVLDAAAAGGGHVISNWGAFTGAILPVAGAAGGPWRFRAQVGVSENASTDAAPAVSRRWELRYMPVGAGGVTAIKNLAAGTAGPATGGGNTATRSWLIGSSWGISDASAEEPGFRLAGCKLAYIGFLSKVLTAREEGWLLDYAQGKMAQRGIAL